MSFTLSQENHMALAAARLPTKHFAQPKGQLLLQPLGRGLTDGSKEASVRLGTG